MSWLSQHTGIHLNLRPLAPVAGGILGSILLPGLGTALGTAIGAGGAGAVDTLANRGNIGDALKTGAVDAALGYGTAKVMGSLGYGRDAAGQASSTPTSGTAATAVTPAATNVVAENAANTAVKSGGLSLADKLALGSTALQGIGGIAGGIAQGQQAQLQRDAYNQYSPLRQAAITALQGRVAQGPPQPFQYQSPFGPPGMQPPTAPVGQDPRATWAAILRARGFPGMQPMGG